MYQVNVIDTTFSISYNGFWVIDSICSAYLLRKLSFDLEFNSLNTEKSLQFNWKNDSAETYHLMKRNQGIKEKVSFLDMWKKIYLRIIIQVMFVKIISWGFKKTTFYVSFSISYVNTSVASSHFFINIFHSVTQKIILVSFFTCFAN